MLQLKPVWEPERPAADVLAALAAVGDCDARPCALALARFGVATAADLAGLELEDLNLMPPQQAGR